MAQRAKSGGALDLCLTLTVSIVYGCSLPSSMLIRQKKTKPKQCILGFLFKVHKGESARAQGNAARPTIRPLFILFLLLDILTICKRFRNASNVLMLTIQSAHYSLTYYWNILPIMLLWMGLWMFKSYLAQLAKHTTIIWDTVDTQFSHSCTPLASFKEQR